MKLLLFIPALFFSSDKIEAVRPASRYISFSCNADAISNFWHWFTKNQLRLRAFESDPDKYLNELLTQAKKIKSGLAIELEPPRNGIINMTISADGNIELFELVRNIVDKAPSIKGWKIFAFRQRMPASVAKGLMIKAGGLQLEPAKMKFLPVIENDNLNVIIYIAGVTEENYMQVAHAGLTLLDNVLGEYDCVTKVHAYDFHEFPDKNDQGPVPRPLLELPAFVDEFHSKK